MHSRSLSNMKQMQELGMLQKCALDHNQIANVDAPIISDLQITLGFFYSWLIPSDYVSDD